MMAREIMGTRRDRGIEQRAKVKIEGWKGRIHMCKGSRLRQNKLFLISHGKLGERETLEVK